MIKLWNCTINRVRTPRSESKIIENTTT